MSGHYETIKGISLNVYGDEAVANELVSAKCERYMVFRGAVRV